MGYVFAESDEAEIKLRRAERGIWLAFDVNWGDNQVMEGCNEDNK